jgi:integrase/recombinase XerC
MVGTLEDALAARKAQERELSELDREIVGRGAFRLTLRLTEDRGTWQRAIDYVRSVCNCVDEIVDREDIPSERSKMLELRMRWTALRVRYEAEWKPRPAAKREEQLEPPPEAAPPPERSAAAGFSLETFRAAPDLREAIAAWGSWLAQERRFSAHTLAAYARDLAAFLAFLAEHLGREAGLAELGALTPADIRAYLALRTERLSASSRARWLSTLRGFFRFLDRRGLARNAAIAVIRSPKQPKLVPKALTLEDAEAVLSAAADPGDRAPWLAVRDVALVTLLYGAGLRISEALAIPYREAPTKAGTLRVKGKGAKVRDVPVLPAVAKAVRDYLAACPFEIEPDGALFRGRHGTPLASFGRRRRSARHSGAAGPFQHIHDAALHGRGPGEDPRGL